MGLNVSDRKWACIPAISLLGIAAFVVFVIHPGGFEGQAVWFFLLLPGAVPAEVLSDLVYKLAPRAEPVVYWALVIGLNCAWYWGIGFAMIKIFRAVGGRWQFGPPDL
jgi:hypothetical protein